MDAVKYVKTLHRLCKSQDGCSECVLESEDGCIAAANRYDKNAVPIVKKWAKEHPVKTRQSEFLKMSPNADLKIIICTLPRCMKLEERRYNDQRRIQPKESVAMEIPTKQES